MTSHPEQYVPIWLPPLLAVAAVVNQDPRDAIPVAFAAPLLPSSTSSDLVDPAAAGSLGGSSPIARVVALTMTLYAALGKGVRRTLTHSLTHFADVYSTHSLNLRGVNS